MQSYIKLKNCWLNWTRWKNAWPLHSKNRTTCSGLLKTALNNVLLPTSRGETRALIGGGGGEYSYIRVLPDEFLLKLTLMTADFKRNSSGRTRRHEYSPPPPIYALVSPLPTSYRKPTQAQQCWTILLTALNNVDRKTLFNAVFNSPEQVVRFFAV